MENKTNMEQKLIGICKLCGKKKKIYYSSFGRICLECSKEKRNEILKNGKRLERRQGRMNETPQIRMFKEQKVTIRHINRNKFRGLQ